MQVCSYRTWIAHRMIKHFPSFGLCSLFAHQSLVKDQRMQGATYTLNEANGIQTDILVALSPGKKMLPMYYVPILDPMTTYWDIKFIRFILHWHSELSDFFIDAAFMAPSSLQGTWERDLGTLYGSSALSHICLDTSKAVRDARLKLTQFRLKHHFYWTPNKEHELRVPEPFLFLYFILGENNNNVPNNYWTLDILTVCRNVGFSPQKIIGENTDWKESHKNVKLCFIWVERILTFLLYFSLFQFY